MLSLSLSLDLVPVPVPLLSLSLSLSLSVSEQRKVADQSSLSQSLKQKMTSNAETFEAKKRRRAFTCNFDQGTG